MVDSERRFFFLHVMRTGGTTFVWHLMANFGPQRVFPAPEDNPETHESVTSIDYLRSVPRARWDELPVVTGHFPYFVLELLPYHYETLTILREPVARTLSFLRQWQHAPGKWLGAPLDVIYDEPAIVPHYQNHMTKLFGLPSGCDAPHYAVDVDIDAEFTARARANLDSIDVVGLTEDHDAFLDEVVERYGWRRPSMPDQHVTERSELPAGFIERIREDNAADIDFYDYAVDLVARRAVS